MARPEVVLFNPRETPGERWVPQWIDAEPNPPGYEPIIICLNPPAEWSHLPTYDSSIFAKVKAYDPTLPSSMPVLYPHPRKLA